MLVQEALGEQSPHTVMEVHGSLRSLLIAWFVGLFMGAMIVAWMCHRRRPSPAIAVSPVEAEQSESESESSQLSKVKRTLRRASHAVQRAHIEQPGG